MIRDAGLADRQERAPGGALATATREEAAAVSAEAGFTSIYETYRPLVYRTCLQVLRDPHEAQDATQETFIRAYRAGDALPPSPGPWLRVVARNHSLDLVRRRARVERMTAQLTAIPSDAVDPGRRAVNRVAVGELLKDLGPREREVLVGSAVEDRTLNSLAGSLGLSYMGTAQLLHRAKRRARRLFGEATALLLPWLPERVRSRTGSTWIQAIQAAVRAPELAAAALVAAVLVAGPGLASPEIAIPQAGPGAGATAREGSGPEVTGRQLLAVPPAPAAASGSAQTADPAGPPSLPSVPQDLTLPGAAGGVVPDLPQVALPPVLPALSDVPVLPPVQAPPPLQPPALPPPPAVPPVTLNLPGPVTVVAVGLSGADVAYQVGASGGEGPLNVSCSRASGSRFPIGATEVRCTAADSAGRSASGAFMVYVVSLPPRPGV